MNNNDQWFSVGDKVMRVSDGTVKHLQMGAPMAPFGKVFCVTHLHTFGHGNSIMLSGLSLWFVASNFRKVEEIKLCVEALKKAKPREKQGA